MSSIAGIDTEAADYAANTSNRITPEKLTQSDFLEVMVAEMTNQTPDNTADTDKYFENLMTMSNYESMLEMDQNVAKVYGMQQQMFTQSLVGETVEVVDDEGNYSTGEVDSAYIMDGTIVVEVNGSEYAASNVTRILKGETGTIAGTQTEEPPTTPEEP